MQWNSLEHLTWHGLPKRIILTDLTCQWPPQHSERQNRTCRVRSRSLLPTPLVTRHHQPKQFRKWAVWSHWIRRKYNAFSGKSSQDKQWLPSGISCYCTWHFFHPTFVIVIHLTTNSYCSIIRSIATLAQLTSSVRLNFTFKFDCNGRRTLYMVPGAVVP